MRNKKQKQSLWSKQKNRKNTRLQKKKSTLNFHTYKGCILLCTSTQYAHLCLLIKYHDLHCGIRTANKINRTRVKRKKKCKREKKFVCCWIRNGGRPRSTDHYSEVQCASTAPQRHISVTGANFDNYLQNWDIRAQGTITHYLSEKVERKTTKSTFRCFGIRQPRKNQRFGHLDRTYFNDQRGKVNISPQEHF